MSVFDVKVDTSALTSLQAAAGRVDAAARAGLTRVAEHVQGIEAMEAGKIYSRPIPTRAQVNARNRNVRRAVKAGRRAPRAPKAGGAGKPAWERSGALLSAVKADPVWQGNSRVELRADVPYGARREGLGTDWQPKAPALGITRKNTFARDTVKRVEPQLGPLFEEGFMKELGL